nr:reticulocyte-binding protein 2 homolog a-like [Penaeus vannamei]
MNEEIIEFYRYCIMVCVSQLHYFCLASGYHSDAVAMVTFTLWTVILILRVTVSDPKEEKIKMADSPLPTSPSPNKFDSFDLDVGTGEEGSSTSAVSGSPSPTFTHPQGREGDRAALIKEVSALYKERYRLARMHRKAELRVVTSLKRRRQANEALTSFLHQQKALVKYSFSALPPEKGRGETVEQLLKRQQQVEEQLKQARSAYYSLALKKQQREDELKRRQETADDQVSVTEMLRLVVETEAYIEEAGVQECSILTSRGSLHATEASIAKHLQRNKELTDMMEEAEAKVEQLRLQISQKKDELKTLAKKQAQSNRLSAHLQPASRLLLDPVLARDLKEKLALKEDLEDELGRLKQLSARSNVRRKSAT